MAARSITQMIHGCFDSGATQANVQKWLNGLPLEKRAVADKMLSWEDSE